MEAVVQGDDERVVDRSKNLTLRQAALELRDCIPCQTKKIVIQAIEVQRKAF